MDKTDTIKTKIISQYDHLTKQQKIIAECILDNLDEVIFDNITELAARTESSVASIVRFATTLGYAGFPQMREDLIKLYKERMDIADRFKRTLERLPHGIPSYADITGSEVEYLQKSIKELDQEAFNKAVHLICNSNRVFIFGNSANECLANNLWFRLDRLGLNTFQVSNSGHSLVERVFRMKSDDVIVAFDFLTPSLDITRIHELSARSGTKIISITDTSNPDMIRNSEIVLRARRGSPEFFNSQVVPSAITNALVIAVTFERGQASIDYLKELSKIREAYSYSPLKNSMKIENFLKYPSY